MPLLRAVGLLPLLLPLTAAGRPTPPVRYELDCRLNDSTRSIAGRVRVRYTHDSRDSLRSIWFLLFPNSFSSRHTAYARALERLGRFELARTRPRDLGRTDILAVRCDGKPIRSGPGTSGVGQFNDDSTAMELILPSPLASGETTDIEIEFSTRIPNLRGPLGYTGRSYVLTRWFPQVAARDTGWHLGRFHPFGGPAAGFADYAVTLTLAPDLQVAATGRTLAPATATGQQKTLALSATGVTDFAIVASADLLRSEESSGPVSVITMSRRRPERSWLNLSREIPAMIELMADRLGPFPLAQLTVVQAFGLVDADIVAPGLILVAQKPVPFTRLQEKTLAAAVAAQWFASATAPDPVSDPWLVYGLSAHAATRYLESRYGPDNLLDVPGLPFTLGATDEYLHRYNYYLAASNRLTRPVVSPLSGLPDNAFAVEAVTKSQSTLLLLAFERRFGSAVLDAGLRRYLESGRGRHPGTPAFLACLTAAAGPEQEGLVSRWFLTDGGDDVALVRSAAGSLRALGSVQSHQPVELSGVLSDGTTFRDTLDPEVAREVAAPRQPRSLVLDPDRLLLESNRWNNYWPRTVMFQPLFGLPSFDGYQIFYGPWFWFDTYRGFQPGAWLQGREFVDAGPVRGRHMWTIQANYCTAMKKDPGHIGFSYQTPLAFISNRTRVFLAGDWSFRDEGAKAYLSQELGRVFGLPSGNLDIGYRLYNLKTAQGRDPRAWTEARTAVLEARLLHQYSTPFVAGFERCRLERGLKPLGSEYDYWRFSTEQIHRLTIDADPIAVLRVFAGATAGTTPDREQYYLSGGLVYNSAEPASFGYQGRVSAQEHWHYDADVNCRGFSGRYAHGRYAWGLNLYATPLKWAQPFFDIGNVGNELNRHLWQPRMNAGIRFRLGPFYADVVAWRWELGRSQFPGKDWTHFWMLGFKLSELTSGF